MTESKARPGVMLYFDIRPAIQRLTLEERGALFTAILDFAELGVAPELDGMAGMCFDLMRPKIERDGERYKEVRSQKRYATYCREVKKAGAIPLSFDEWLSGDNQPISDDIGRYPSTSTATSITATASTATTSTTATPSTTTTEGEAEGLSRGTEREPLTEDDYFRQLPLDKQIAYLRQNGAKNHG